MHNFSSYNSLPILTDKKYGGKAASDVHMVGRPRETGAKLPRHEEPDDGHAQVQAD